MPLTPSKSKCYLAVLRHFIFGHMPGGFDVDKVLSHLFQLCGLHKKLSQKKKVTSDANSLLNTENTKLQGKQTLYLSASPLECRKYLLISWVRTDTGLLTLGEKKKSQVDQRSHTRPNRYPLFA